MIIKNSDYESIVYDAIMEYLDQNRYLNVDTVVPYLISRFSNTSVNLNKKGILSIIDSLIRKNLIVEGSKLVKDDILKNSNRYNIFQYIIKNPAIYFYKILADLQYPNHVIIWHLNILEDFGFIKKSKIKKNVVYSEISLDREDVKTIFYLKKKPSKIIIQKLRKNNLGLTKTQISKSTKMHPNTVKKYVKVLDSVGILAKEKYSHKTIYFLNEKKLENIKNKLSEQTSRSIEKELFANHLDESDIEVEKREYVCVVHKGIIKGTIFVCPDCQTIYCQKCAKFLEEKGEKCWSCESEIKL